MATLNHNPNQLFASTPEQAKALLNECWNDDLLADLWQKANAEGRHELAAQISARMDAIRGS